MSAAVSKRQSGHKAGRERGRQSLSASMTGGFAIDRLPRTRVDSSNHLKRSRADVMVGEHAEGLLRRPVSDRTPLQFPPL